MLGTGNLMVNIEDSTQSSHVKSQGMQMSSKNKFHSLCCLTHEIVELLHNPVGYGNLRLILGKNIPRCLQRKVLR